MKKFRALFKIVLIVSWTLSCYAVYLFFYGLIRLFRLRYEGWRNRLMYWWSAGCCKILSLTINTEGPPPDAPFVLVCNHMSYIDILPLYLNLNCTFVAKKEVRSWPLLGFMVMTMGVIFVDRSRKRDVTRVNQLVSESMNEKQGIIIFAEGTTSAGKEILPFRSPLLEIPAAEGIGVHYAALRYETGEGDRPASESVCWFGGDPLGGHMMKLASNRKVDCKLVFGEKTVQSNDRKELAAKLHEGVKGIFVPGD